MYSLMSIRIMAFSLSNKNSASARDNSVLPTPVGPRKIMSRVDDLDPAIQHALGGPRLQRLLSLPPVRPRANANALPVLPAFRVHLPAIARPECASNSKQPRRCLPQLLLREGAISWPSRFSLSRQPVSFSISVLLPY